MKNISLVAFVLATSLVHANHSQARPASNSNSAKSLSLSIPSMHCQGCAMGVEATLGKVPGVRSVKADAARKKAVVSYMGAKVSPKTIMATLAKAGWESTVIAAKTPQKGAKVVKTAQVSESEQTCPDCP